MTRDQMERLVEAFKADSPEFKAAWDAAEAAVRARGLDPSQGDMGAVLDAVAAAEVEAIEAAGGDPGDALLSHLKEQWDLSAEQDAKAAAAPPRKAKMLHELVGFGKPLLVTASGAGVLSMAKEVAWKLGDDPQVVAADPMFDDAMLEAEFRATSAGGTVILDELHRASPEVRLKALELAKDPDRRVIVALPCKPLPEMPPEAFGHWADFSKGR